MNIARQAIHYAAPIVLSEVISMGWQDPRIGKIVGGVGLIGSGAYLIAGSLKNRSWKRLFLGLTGGATACYGAHNVIQGVLELLYPKEAANLNFGFLAHRGNEFSEEGEAIFSEGNSRSAIHEGKIASDFQKSVENVRDKPKTQVPIHLSPRLSQTAQEYVYIDATGTPIAECNKPQEWPEKEQMIMNTLKTCSVTKNLGELVTKFQANHHFPPWRVKIMPANTLPFGADSLSNTGEIRIACNYDQPTSAAAFELTNLKSINRYNEIFRQVYANIITDRNAYAKATERVEFDGNLEHISMMESCMKERGWGPGVQFYIRKSWEIQWKKIIFSPHTEAYRKQFDEIQKQRLDAQWRGHLWAGDHFEKKG